MARIYGYARPTASLPDPSAHARQLADAGAEHIFVEKTGSQVRRGMRERQRLFKQIGAGDRLILLSLDRLGTNLEDVLRCLDMLVARGLDLNILDAGFATRNAPGSADLLKMLIATLSALHSETVKLNLASARARGGKAAGKTLSLDLEQWPAVKARIADATLETVAQELGVSRQTLWTYRRRMAALETAAAS
jgi:DNA invertase Pin-like site-specific DNA recombinase